MISENTLQQIKDLSITDVIIRYVTLKQGLGCCPFHAEKTGSFRVNERKGYYKCFGCGAGGDAIKFVQEHDKLSFYEAIESMAKQHNITIEYIESNITPEERKAQQDKTETAKKILNFVHDFYQQQLQSNANAMAYLHERGFNDEQIKEWQLGFAPDDFKTITPLIIKNGWYETAIEIGLIKTKEGTSSTYDVYRNRIIIPIYDKYRQLIGFGGRYIGDDKTQAKYYNPNENFLYKKSSLVYGLDTAEKAIKEKNRVVLVEGYFDVISCQQHGLENTVATCGTACDEKQLKLLQRYTNNITIMTDADKAGQSAAEKITQLALKIGMNPFIVELEKGIDPDELARNYVPN